MNFLALNDDVKFIISKHLASDFQIRTLLSKNHDLQKILFGVILYDDDFCKYLKLQIRIYVHIYIYINAYIKIADKYIRTYIYAYIYVYSIHRHSHCPRQDGRGYGRRRNRRLVHGWWGGGG
jgi:hypothetical protein